MISRSTALGVRNDQMVLFTLVELMTHLIFLALMLGLALRKEADPVYQKFKQDQARYAALSAENKRLEQQLAGFVQKCGADGAGCVKKAKGGRDLPNCMGSGSALVSLRGLADGRIAIMPAGTLPSDMRSRPEVAGFLRLQTVSQAEFTRLSRSLLAASNKGSTTGRACQFYASFCSAATDTRTFAQQKRLVDSAFYPKGTANVCR